MSTFILIYRLRSPRLCKPRNDYYYDFRIQKASPLQVISLR